MTKSNTTTEEIQKLKESIPGTRTLDNMTDTAKYPSSFSSETRIMTHKKRMLLKSDALKKISFALGYG
jgi:hypothetical protein